MNVKIEEIMDKLLTVLPLPEGVTAETVTADQINEALDNLIKEDAVEEMENTIQQLGTELVNRDLETYAAVIKDREAVKAQLLANRAGTLKLLEGLKLQAAPEGRKTPVFNRENAGTPGSVGNNKPAQDNGEAARAAKIRNRAHELERSEKLPWQQAFKKAESEFPASAPAPVA